MPKKTMAIVMFAVILLAGGCGQSTSQQEALANKRAASDDTSGLCPAISGTGLTKQCTVNSRDGTVHVIIDNDDDQAARDVCAEVVSRVAQQTAALSARWMLQVYSPYRDDKPLAACPFH